VNMHKAFVFARNPAHAVQASVEVCDPVTGTDLASFTCRWQGTPQPVVLTGPDKYVPNIAGIPYGQRGDVFQHEPEALDLFVKFDGDREFYGFPNEAYFAYVFVRHDRSVLSLARGLPNPRRDRVKTPLSNEHPWYMGRFMVGGASDSG
jgi:hypothetical protein